ncbi:MAG: glycosyltransferase family 2 protein [Hyphomicrobiaceae bacterium]|nr:glycosyltransferase family 2 protein [Hyphomicrobiaceae bacterium]
MTLQFDLARKRAAEARHPRVAVLIPCYNEVRSVAAVVAGFAAALPEARIYVYDNNSSDGTAEAAAAAGAIVRREPRQGKGNVVRRMFSDIEADVYVMVDGDSTYDAPSARRLVETLWQEQLDLVNGARVATGATLRPGHAFGNRLLSSLVRAIFGTGTGDMLSGYKVFSRRYVKSFPALSAGFEVETELVIHALEMRMPMGEIATPYRDRPPGSASKLRTFSDGFRILRLIGFFVREEKPLAFFASLALVLASLSLLAGIPVVLEYLETGLVPRLPTAVLALGLMLAAMLSVTCGSILDSIARGRREMKRLHYMAAGPPGTDA